MVKWVIQSVLLLFLGLHAGIYVGLYFLLGPLPTLLIFAAVQADNVRRRYNAWKFQWDMVRGMEARQANAALPKNWKVSK